MISLIPEHEVEILKRRRKRLVIFIVGFGGVAVIACFLIVFFRHGIGLTAAQWLCAVLSSAYACFLYWAFQNPLDQTKRMLMRRHMRDSVPTERVEGVVRAITTETMTKDGLSYWILELETTREQTVLERNTLWPVEVPLPDFPAHARIRVELSDNIVTGYELL